MGKKSRDKGKKGERELAGLLRMHGYDARRGAQNKGGPDSPDVIGLDGAHIEVKRTESLRLYDALAQAESDSGGAEFPVVFHRKNNKKWVAILDAEDFVEIYGNHRKYLESI